MNFKRWLLNNEFNFALNEMNGAYSEIESNNMTEKLANWIKTHHRQPLLQTPILSGSPTANRIAYDTDIEENLLANFLKNRKDAKALKINYFPSDEQILINHGLDGLFGTDKLSGLQKAINYAKLIAAFYNNPENKRMPSTRSKDETEVALGRKLYNFRSAKKGIGSSTHYPEAEQAGIDAGLPEDWMDAKDFILESRRQSAIEDAKLIAAFYTNPENKRMPSKNSNDETEAALGRKLHNFRQAKKGNNIRSAHYPEAEQVGIDAGLPKGWMDTKYNIDIKSI